MPQLWDQLFSMGFSVVIRLLWSILMLSLIFQQCIINVIYLLKMTNFISDCFICQIVIWTFPFTAVMNCLCKLHTVTKESLQMCHAWQISFLMIFFISAVSMLTIIDYVMPQCIACHIFFMGQHNWFAMLSPLGLNAH